MAEGRALRATKEQKVHLGTPGDVIYQGNHFSSTSIFKTWVLHGREGDKIKKKIFFEILKNHLF